jgi:hypothetical protein
LLFWRRICKARREQINRSKEHLYLYLYLGKKKQKVKENISSQERQKGVAENI